jgi:hypothetical protein
VALPLPPAYGHLHPLFQKRAIEHRLPAALEPVRDSMFITSKIALYCGCYRSLLLVKNKRTENDKLSVDRLELWGGGEYKPPVPYSLSVGCLTPAGGWNPV